MLLWRTTRPSRTNMKRCPFHHRGLEFQCRKSRDTWSKRQVWPWNRNWSRTKANRVLSRKHTGNSKHPLLAMQEMTLLIDINRWSILKSDGLYSLQQRWINSLQTEKTRLGANSGSDHQLFIARFRLKLKKVGKTMRPFRYNLNQFPYSYTVEV